MHDLHEAARERLAREKGSEAAAKAASSVLQRYMDKEQAELLKLLRKRVTMQQAFAVAFEPLAMTVSNGFVRDWDPVDARSSYMKAGTTPMPRRMCWSVVISKRLRKRSVRASWKLWNAIPACLRQGSRMACRAVAPPWHVGLLIRVTR